jgi:hypothetical protein
VSYLDTHSIALANPFAITVAENAASTSPEGQLSREEPSRGL